MNLDKVIKPRIITNITLGCKAGMPYAIVKRIDWYTPGIAHNQYRKVSSSSIKRLLSLGVLEIFND